MANTWGENRTGYDKELYDLGTVLQNIGSLNTLRVTISSLQKIEKKMAEKKQKEYEEYIEKKYNIPTIKEYFTA